MSHDFPFEPAFPAAEAKEPLTFLKFKAGESLFAFNRETGIIRNANDELKRGAMNRYGFLPKADSIYIVATNEQNAAFKITEKLKALKRKAELESPDTII